jgi:tRNA 2-thiouridine synthesizing protein A
MQCPRGTATIRAVPAAEADSCLDTRGLVCPEPLLLVRNRVREMRRGEILNVLATDPTTQRDFANFCHFMGHRMLQHEVRDGVHHYRLQKG